MTDDSTDGRRTSTNPVSRRRALQLTAGGSMFALAGCLGNGGSSTDTDGGGDTQADTDTEAETDTEGESTDTEGESTDTEGESTDTEGESSETDTEGEDTETGTESDDGGTQTTGGGSVEVTDKTYVSYLPSVPTDIQFNPLSTAATDFYTKSAIHAWTAQITTTSDPPQYVPMVAKNWSLDGSTFTIELNDSFTWHHGKSLTAEDLAMHYRLDQQMGAGKYYGIWDLVDSMEVTGDYTLEMQLSGDTNEQLMANEAFGEPLAYDPKVYNEYLTQFQDASDSEKEDIRAELTEMTIEEPVGAGPLKFVSADNQKFVFEPYEEFPWAEVQQQFSDATGADITDWPDRPNFSQVNFKYAPADRLQQEIRSGSVDGGYAAGSVDPNNLPQNFKPVQIPGLYGWSIIYNFWDSGFEDWRDPNVRKAFAHLFDRPAIATQMLSENAQPDEYITGMTASQESAWLDDSFMESLDTYERDPEAAAEYLQASDYTRENGQWYKPNGDRFTAPFKTAAGVARYVSGLQVASSNLQEFGIKSSLTTEENTTYFSKEPNQAGYQLEAAPDYGGSQPFPSGAFEFVYLKEAVTNDAGETDYYLPGEETLEVPPVGQPDSDETITVDPQARIQELTSTTDEAAQTEIIKELAWATNQAAPQVPIVEALLQGALGTDGWEYPPMDHPAVNMKSAAFMGLMFQFGVVRATE